MTQNIEHYKLTVSDYDYFFNCDIPSVTNHYLWLKEGTSSDFIYTREVPTTYSKVSVDCYAYPMDPTRSAMGAFMIVDYYAMATREEAALLKGNGITPNDPNSLIKYSELSSVGCSCSTNKYQTDLYVKFNDIITTPITNYRTFKCMYDVTSEKDIINGLSYTISPVPNTCTYFSVTVRNSIPKVRVTATYRANASDSLGRVIYGYAPILTYSITGTYELCGGATQSFVINPANILNFLSGNIYTYNSFSSSITLTFANLTLGSVYGDITWDSDSNVSKTGVISDISYGSSSTTTLTFTIDYNDIS